MPKRALGGKRWLDLALITRGWAVRRSLNRIHWSESSDLQILSTQQVGFYHRLLSWNVLISI